MSNIRKYQVWYQEAIQDSDEWQKYGGLLSTEDNARRRAEALIRIRPSRRYRITSGSEVVWARDRRPMPQQHALDVLATIRRGCDPLPSETPIVNDLALRGLIVFDPMNAQNVIGYRVTEYGMNALKGEQAG